MLGLDQIHNNHITEDEVDPSQDQLDLRSRIKINDKICSQITDDIFLGSETVSANYELLTSKGITHILNCASTICKTYFPGKFEYRCLYLLDSREEDITCLLYNVIDLD